MRIYLMSFVLFLSGCASTGVQNSIKMPEVTNIKPKEYYIKQASKNKIRIGSRLKQNFDFFYGPNGSYFIVVSSQENRISLKEYEVTLKINSASHISPEQISMAVEDDQVVSGFGEFREGATSFEVILSPIHPEMSPAFKFDFNVDLQPVL